jgi:hypothetical protein
MARNLWARGRRSIRIADRSIASGDQHEDVPEGGDRPGACPAPRPTQRARPPLHGTVDYWNDLHVKKQVFISYSHNDDKWRARLVQTLAPFVRNDEIDVWDDTQISPGEQWGGRIEAQIDRSNVAVLLVSTDFLASSYVTEVELPRLVAAADSGRLTLVWVPVSASLWDSTDLRRFQAAVNPDTPLNHLSKPKAEAALVTIARKITAGRTLTDVGNAMEIVDVAYDELQGSAKPHRVEAHHTAEGVTFVDRKSGTAVESITADELEQLPDDQHLLVQSLETSMRTEFERWTILRPRRATLTASERATYEEAGRLMCKELTHILDFLLNTLHKNLYDHYGGIRFACDELVSAGSDG